jgi:two-component system, chemotaxis family, protein-glutamate methylesterase/glutaminase
MKYEAVVLGVSSGGMNALKVIFSCLPEDFNIPVVIVQHLNARSNSEWIKLLNDKSRLDIKEADEKEEIKKGKIYIAPPNYHLLIERNKTFSFTIDERVNFARPSIDVLFESAAEACKDKLIGVILTGSNSDGTNGMKKIKEYGGLTIAQDPHTAESPFMPASAIAAIQMDHVLPLGGIIDLLIKISKQQ